MRKTKVLKLTLVILIIILLSIISFVGVYIQNKNLMENILPEYILSKELRGYTMVELKVSEQDSQEGQTTSLDTTEANETNPSNKTDENNTTSSNTTEQAQTNSSQVADQNEVADTNTTENANDAEEKSEKTEGKLTSENYKKAKKIISKRLEDMQVTNYTIRQNTENGTIILELPKNDNTDDAIGEVTATGKFEIVDDETKEVLMTNDDIKSVKSGYGTNSSGKVVAFVNIQFNNAGTKKFKDITNTYVETKAENNEAKSEEDNEQSENNAEEQAKENQEVANVEDINQENKDNEKAEENADASKEDTTKQVTIKLDGTELFSTHFDQEISNGLLQLTMGSSSNSTEELQEYLKSARSFAATLNSGNLPIDYEVAQNKYISSNMTVNVLKIAIIITVAIFAIALCYMMVKYKWRGLLASISQIGYVAVLLLAIRYFNVEVSIGGIATILFSIIISYCIAISMLKQKEMIKAIGKWAIILIPTLIISICFIFANILIGAVLFWGLTIALLYHISITNLLLRD